MNFYGKNLTRIIIYKFSIGYIIIKRTYERRVKKKFAIGLLILRTGPGANKNVKYVI